MNTVDDGMPSTTTPNNGAIYTGTPNTGSTLYTGKPNAIAVSTGVRSSATSSGASPAPAHQHTTSPQAGTMGGAIYTGQPSGGSATTTVPNNSADSTTTNQNTNPSTSSTAYVALGDSVAAGLGLGGDAGPAPNDQCGRSAAAYPNVVAQARGLTVNNIACTGATAGDLFTRQGVDGPNIAAQLDTSFANGTPQLISITAGTNDIHWDEFLRYCYAVSDCADTAESVLAGGYQSLLWLKLQYLLADIQARSSGQPPRVVVTGYYNPLSDDCLNQQQDITASELAWLNNHFSQLNNTLRWVVGQYDFTTFVPIDFSGHDICSADPWVQGVNDPAPFHPTVQGQEAVAQTVLAAL